MMATGLAITTAIREHLCERCELSRQTWYCANCDSYYCDPCWDKLGPHKSGKKGLDGLSHEKTDPEVRRRLEAILSPDSCQERQEELHRDDYDTTWFGIDQEDHDPVFQDYGRYTSIMVNSLSSDMAHRYPQLVSFIGQTGAGKSTIVKMLIDLQESRCASLAESFASPVVSSVDSNIPTSADVHLYSDPATYQGHRPILYADCEGLDGGEIDPLAIKYVAMETEQHPTKDSTKRRAIHKIRKVTRSSRLVWADTPEKKRRQFAVTELYPRLLYTFSDVIVFVLRNSKTFEKVLVQLLNWAFASIEKSLNQPYLPHAIIALNATDNSIDARQWDVTEATNTLLKDIDAAIDRVPRFGKYAEYWRSRGKTVRTMKDLLQCFYTSVTIIRMPSKGRYMLMHQQVNRLYDEVASACNKAYIARQKMRMLCNADDLQTYLRFAFDHFSQDLDKPFNFSEISLLNNPIPLDLGGNILKLALTIQQRRTDLQSGGRHIFDPLAKMVASCIMLDLTRQKYQGTALDLLEKHYFEYCIKALRDFCERHYTCSYRDARGRCVNTKIGHGSKGHQNAKGKVLAVGNFMSDFTFETYEETWKDNLRHYLDMIRKDLQLETFGSGSIDEQQLALSLHLRCMNLFYSKLGGAGQFISQSACFCCLREMARHPLPCGHVLCTKCIEAYGKIHEKNWVSMNRCPLHNADTEWPEPFLLQFKPRGAGVRLLTLDGGGVRGIVELEVLRTIEKELGGKMHIQAFFDLIVGTSTGGIIALGLGVEGWSVQTCIEKFKRLCGKAFTPRDFHGLPFFQQFAFIHHHSLYKTRPFEIALQEAFGRGKAMFSSGACTGDYRVNTAVTSATGTGQSAVVIANYNRTLEEEDDSNYIFERAEDVRDELTVWEAARATSAAPKYFKPFQSYATRKEYWDGALYHNNPVFIANHERKLLWPETSSAPPDIILSIGTGMHHNHTTETRAHPFRRSSSHEMPDTAQTRRDWAQKPKWQHLFSILVNRLDDVFDSERIWKRFMMDIEPNTTPQTRYQRLNVDLGKQPPKLDAVNEVDSLQAVVASRLQKQPEYRKQIKQIAEQLVASCFYFEKSFIPPVETPTGFQVFGFICSRFLSGSPEMRHLGNWLRHKQVQNFQPHFSIEEFEDAGEISHQQRFTISEDTIQNMTTRAVFELQEISIAVSNRSARVIAHLHLEPNGTGIVISGFPRALIDEENNLSKTRSTSSSSNTRSASQSTKSPPTTPNPDRLSESTQRISASSSVANIRNAIYFGRNSSKADHKRKDSFSSKSAISLQKSTSPKEDDSASSVDVLITSQVSETDSSFRKAVEEALEASLRDGKVEDVGVLADTASAMGITYF